MTTKTKNTANNTGTIPPWNHAIRNVVPQKKIYLKRVLFSLSITYITSKSASSENR